MSGNILYPTRRLNGDKLCAARKAAGYRSKRVFAEAIGMTKQNYLKWEGRNPPRDVFYQPMRRALELLSKSFEDISDEIGDIEQPSWGAQG
ncbi:hypothetical protein [Deinococcus sp. Leaf326]|jgi:transcriptional regulator with XRE-family HTH domain|uniref:hypothetical protein n=1 Tax=Deinococcus sp. Leaf326 TaxID=1736338 RepID=UPI000B0B61A6|nr:hypothetical protein [Deinococcus sp. Leaf326]